MPPARELGEHGPPAAKRRTVELHGMAAEALANVSQRESDVLEQAHIAGDERPIEAVRPCDQPQRGFEIGMLAARKADRRFDRSIGDAPCMDAALSDPYSDASLVRTVDMLREISECA